MRRTLAVLPAVALLGACGAAPETPAGDHATNTLPFTGGVYVVSTINEKYSPNKALHQVWPNDAAPFYAGFSFDAERFAFRPTDNQLFYVSPSDGVRIDDAVDEKDTNVPTPPCQSAEPPFFGHEHLNWSALGFDGQGVVYYECEGLRRGSGELVDPLMGMSAVLADGRYVRVIGDGTDPAAFGFAAFAPDGTMLSKLTPSTELEGVGPIGPATTVAGNDAFVLFNRADVTTGFQTSIELLAYRLDAQSQWLPVVRRATPHYGIENTILSDGTILVLESDDRPATQGHWQVTAVLPDGSERVAWRDRESNVTAGLGGLVVGPRQPTGPSVQTP